MQTKGIYICAFLLLNICVLSSQSHVHFGDDHICDSPYEISWIRESKFIGSSLALLGTSFYLKSQYGVLTDEEIFALDPMDINGFDRNSVSNTSASAKRISDYFAFGSMTIPLFFIAEKKCRLNTGHIVTMWLEANLLTFSLTEVAKHAVRRSRPYVYNSDIPNIEKQDVNSRLSFFSGHVAQTSANSFFAAKVFSDYFPESKLKNIVWITAAVLPAVTAYGRVKAGRHFPTDAITGYIVGSTIGILIPTLHHIPEDKTYKIDLSASGNGVLFRMVF